MSKSQEQSEQEHVRRDKLFRLREAGFCFPNNFTVTTICSEVRALADTCDRPNEGHLMSVAGRILAIRLMGKAAFVQLRDRSGRLQVYLRSDDIGQEAFENFKNLDLGDIVGVTGFCFKTKTGEPSLHAKEVRLLVKCLHPLPEKWHGLVDVETRYRQRYLDLMMNDTVRDNFFQRSRIVSGIRNFLNSRDYVEVETAVLSDVASGASARPFVTHHNVLHEDRYLRIALELPLKRLVVGGMERVYEIGRVFRNEGVSTHHNPEFTMLEFYQAYATYEDMMVLTEDLIVSLCDEVIGKREIPYGERVVNYERPWKRITMVEAIYEFAGVPREFNLLDINGVRLAADFLAVSDNIQEFLKMSAYGLALYEIFDRFVENKIVDPTFVTEFPLEVSPLSRKNADDSRFVDRFELFVAGIEVANAFSELNDPEDQLQRFVYQAQEKARGNEEAMELDEDFVRALEYGMPPTAGEGIGIDRLVMLLTNQVSIRDVILFPQMRRLVS